MEMDFVQGQVSAHLPFKLNQSIAAAGKGLSISILTNLDFDRIKIEISKKP